MPVTYVSKSNYIELKKNKNRKYIMHLYPRIIVNINYSIWPNNIDTIV